VTVTAAHKSDDIESLTAALRGVKKMESKISAT